MSIDKSRRAFFSRGARRAAEVVVHGAEARAKARARHWLRPPYALDELEFLLACTRCGDCIAACPHDVIFSLPPRLGAQVAGTPALDLLNKGCHLCADWPCVSVCEPGALRLPQPEQPSGDQAATTPGPNSGEQPTLQLAVVEIDAQACLPYLGPECGGCAHSCPVEGAMVWERDQPRIVQALCTGCALCREACILEDKAIQLRSLS